MPNRLSALFLKYTGAPPEKITPLKAHASDRQIFRIIGSGKSLCGVINSDIKENQAFIHFARCFRSNGLPVPEIYIVSEDFDAYLQEDLGDTTLFDLLALSRTNDDMFPSNIETLYREALSYLINFQLNGAIVIDYNICHQHTDFDRDAMLWDMNYFKNSFLSHIKLPLDTSNIECDFYAIADFLVSAPAMYFMYRDFQARNIMVKGDQLYFIDFQAGRRGPLQYDVASLLYQSSAALPQVARDRLLQSYLSMLNEKHGISSEDFMKYYSGFVLIRIFQALGTYGKQGLESGKGYFLRSINPALNNLNTVFVQLEKSVKLPALNGILSKLKESSYV